MQEMDPKVFLAVFQEMFGLWLWVGVALLALLGLALIVVLVRERGLVGRRLLQAQWAAVPGGFLAIAILIWMSSSRITDMGTPVDWLLLEAVFLGGLVLTTMVVYVGLACTRGCRLR